MERGKNISMCGNQSELSQWLAGEAGPLDGVTCQFLGQQVAQPPRVPLGISPIAHFSVLTLQ